MFSAISNSIESLPTPENHWFGIGIKKISHSANHSGVVFHDSLSGEKKILHLGWHNDLRLDEVSNSYRWVKLHEDYDEDNARDFALLCQWIFEANKYNVPYGVKFDGTIIDETTNKIQFRNGEAIGLTCSTFAMLVFNRFGIELVDSNTWEKRDSDNIWFDLLIQNLGSTNVPYEHVHILKKQIPCARIRPEEIAASCQLANKPNVFHDVLPLSELLLEEITEHWKSRQAP